MIRSEAGGLKNCSQLDGNGALVGFLRRPQCEEGSNRKEHELSPSPSSSMLSDLCRIASSSPCCFTLPLPSWDCASSASAVSNLLAGTTLSCFLFPFLSARVPAPHEQVS